MLLDLIAEVTENRQLSADYNVLALDAPAIAAQAKAGQFVMVKPRRGSDPLLRRPFSVFEVRRHADGTPSGFSLLNKRIGPTTELLFRARQGDAVDCFGPLGRPFTPPDPPAAAWMVAGGVGLAPFATLAETCKSRGLRSTLFYGARRAGELFCLDLFRDLDVELVLATEDGSAGEHGRVVAPFERRLAAMRADSPVVVYACGPEGMLAATAAAAGRYRRPCQVSVERIMGCGLGGCYSCIVPMRDGASGFHHVRSCLAGPVLPGDQILWNR